MVRNQEGVDRFKAEVARFAMKDKDRDREIYSQK
jgi:hypothetical protein